MTCLACRDGRGFGSIWLGSNRLAETADHKERVIDSQAEPQHRRQILNQNGQVPTQGQKSCNRKRGRDGQLTNGYWNQGRHQTSESQQQKCERDRNRESFGVLYIVGARFPNVEIKWGLSR